MIKFLLTLKKIPNRQRAMVYFLEVSKLILNADIEAGKV